MTVTLHFRREDFFVFVGGDRAACRPPVIDEDASLTTFLPAPRVNPAGRFAGERCLSPGHGDEVRAPRGLDELAEMSPPELIDVVIVSDNESVGLVLCDQDPV